MHDDDERRYLWTVGRIFGAPFEVHASTLFLVVLAMFALRNGVVAFLLNALALVVIIVVHEFGHALVARWNGLPVHGVRLAFPGGYCAYGPPETARQEIAVAWGGVGAQALLALVALGAGYAFALPGWAAQLCGHLIELNLIIAVLNLLPIPPLDGHTAWRVLTPWARAARARIAEIEARRPAVRDQVADALKAIGDRERAERERG